MNIYVNDATQKRDVNIARVYDCTYDGMRQLFTTHEREQLTIYVIITTQHIPQTTSLSTGLCRRMSRDVFIIYIKQCVQWVETLRHELYHVHQFYDELPLCERQCNQFAALPSHELDAQ